MEGRPNIRRSNRNSNLHPGSVSSKSSRRLLLDDETADDQSKSLKISSSCHESSRRSAYTRSTSERLPSQYAGSRRESDDGSSGKISSRSSRERRISADRAPNEPLYSKKRSADPLSKSSHAKLGGPERLSRSSSHRNRSSSHHRNSKSKPRRHKSVDMAGLSFSDDNRFARKDDTDLRPRRSSGSSSHRNRSSSRHRNSKRKPKRHKSFDMAILTEDEEKISFSDENRFARKDETELRPRLSRQDSKRRNAAATLTLYGNDEDAKSKAKVSRESSKRAIKPGVENVSKNDTPISIIYGKHVNAKAKPTVSNGGRQRASNPDAIEVSSSSTRPISTLYRKNSDAKAKAKDIGNAPGVEQVLDPSVCGTSSSDFAINPGGATILNSSTPTSISTLYGGDGDAKAKAKASTSGFARNPGMQSEITNTLYGTDSAAKSKARAARGGSAIATNPDVTSVALDATLIVNEDETNVAEPIAKRLSMTSTSDKSGSSLRDSKRESEIGNDNSPEARDTMRIPNDLEATPKRYNRTKNGSDEEPKKSRQKRVAFFVLVLLLVVGGIVAWYLLFMKEHSSEEAQIGTSTAPASTTVGSIAPSYGGNTTISPTSPPALDNLWFQPPSDSDCDAISKNETIAGRDELKNSYFGLGLEVVLSENHTLAESLENELLDAIQEKILPSLAGCNILFDVFVDAWRFVIFDAFVTGNVLEEKTCNDAALLTVQNCHLVSIQLDLFLKGQVRFIDIIGLIQAEEENISNHLGLSGPFSSVKLVRIDNLNPTASPSMIPIDAPSCTPSILPTVQDSAYSTPLPTSTPPSTVNGAPTATPSLIPTALLSRVPTTSSPATPPSFPPIERASESPSYLPSDTPSGTPSDTPSVSPSHSPSGTPTGAPSGTPSVALSSRPSETPSVTPSTMPTSTPTMVSSMRPTVLPSRPPTNFPSISSTRSPAPSRDPTAMPTSSLSSKPSRLPSTAPSSQPTTVHWAACGLANACGNEHASPQNSNHNRVEGSPFGIKIAVRCCSDTMLPGFEQNFDSCPYTDSEVNGVCYDSVTYHEAESLCQSLGARLCTIFEVAFDCTKSTKCGHDSRFVWTSSPEVQPSTTGHWAVCGRRNRCPIPAIVQDAAYDKIGGASLGSDPEGADIAVRCCSDVELPGFLQHSSSCPFANSEFDGVCYDNASYDEAFNLCAGVGARLCTKAELENNCLRGSGCWHDNRMVWSGGV